MVQAGKRKKKVGKMHFVMTNCLTKEAEEEEANKIRVRKAKNITSENERVLTVLGRIYIRIRTHVLVSSTFFM